MRKFLKSATHIDGVKYLVEAAQFLGLHIYPPGPLISESATSLFERAT